MKGTIEESAAVDCANVIGVMLLFSKLVEVLFNYSHSKSIQVDVLQDQS